MNTSFSISPLSTLVADRSGACKTQTIELIRNLSSADSQTRCNAARELGNRGRIGILGKHGNAAIKALLNALGHKDLNTAEAADAALVQIGEPAAPFLRDIIYGSDNETLRERTVTCLGNMRGKAHAALPAVRSIARQDEEKIGVRFAAVWAVGNIVSNMSDYSETDWVVTELSAILTHPNSHMRYCAAEALGKIGKRAEDSIIYLKPLLKDKDPTVRSYAKWALAQIAPEAYGGGKNITKPAEKSHKKIHERIRDAEKEEEKMLKTDK